MMKVTPYPESNTESFIMEMTPEKSNVDDFIAEILPYLGSNLGSNNADTTL